MPGFDDFNVMLEDMAAYVRRTGHTLLSADNPKERSFGFVVLENQNTEWTIGLGSTRRSLNDGERTPRTLALWEAIQGPFGRQALASAISRTGDVDEALARVATETVIDPVQACLEPPVLEPRPTEPPARTVEDRLRDDDILPP